MAVVACYQARYRLLHNLDLGPEIDLGISHARESIRQNPKAFHPYSPLGLILGAKGVQAQRTGQDPLPYWEDALNVLGQGVSVNPKYVEIYGVRAQLHTWWAKYLAEKRQPYAAHVALARQDGAHALAMDPHSPWTLEAMVELETGRPFGDPARARKILGTVDSIYPHDPVAGTFRTIAVSMAPSGRNTPDGR